MTRLFRPEYFTGFDFFYGNHLLRMKVKKVTNWTFQYAHKIFCKHGHRHIHMVSLAHSLMP